MIAVLEVLPGNRAIVSTVDLFRVQAEPSGKILAELLPETEAGAFVKGYNSGDCKQSPVILPYVA